MLLQGRTSRRTAAAVTAAAAPSVKPALTVAGLAVAFGAVAFVMVAFAAVGSTIATSTIGSSLAILGTRSFTIPIHTTDTIPTAIILMVMDTAAFVVAALLVAAAAFAAVAFATVGDPNNQPVYQGSAGSTDQLVEQSFYRAPDEEKSIHQSFFQRRGIKVRLRRLY